MAHRFVNRDKESGDLGSSFATRPCLHLCVTTDYFVIENKIPEFKHLNGILNEDLCLSIIMSNLFCH